MKFGLALLLGCHLAWASPQASFTLDSRFITGAPANRAVAQFGLEFHDALYRLYHWGTPENQGWRVLYFLGTAFALGQLGIQQSWFISHHEYGHASRADAFQKFRLYGAFDESTYQYFLPYFVKNLFGRAKSGSVSFDGAGLGAKERFIVFAAGMNNSSFFADQIDSHLRGPGSSYLFLSPYLEHRLDALNYVVNGGADIDFVLNYYQATRGYTIEEDDIKVGSAVSLLASNSFWALLVGTGKGLYSGAAAAPPIRVGNVELPNFSFYLTSQGLSLKGSTAWYVSPGWLALPGLEVVYHGETRFEPSLKVQWMRAPWRFQGEVTVSKGFTLGGGAQRDFAPWFAGTGIKLYQGDTLEGERLSPNLTKETALQLWANVGIRY